MGAYGDLWGSMGTYWGLWGPMGTFGGLWGPIGAYGGLWGPMGIYGGLGGPLGAYGGHWDLWVFGFWFLVGPPEATAKPKGGRRKIAAPNRPQGGLLGPARVGRSGQQVTAQPAPPGAVTGRKNFVFGGEGGLRVGVVVGRFLGGGGGGGGAARGCARGAAWHRAGARCGAATRVQ